MEAETETDGKPGILKPEVDQPKVKAFLEAVLERSRVPGISVAMSVAGVTLEAAAGISNAQTGDEMTPDMCFEMGCLNKFLTAIMVLELVKDNEIELEQFIPHYLPELEGRIGNRIRIRHLLNHTGGYEEPAIDDPDIQQDYSYEAFAADFNERARIAEPGSLFRYSHTASVLLGRTVEAVTGNRVGKLIRQKMLMPLDIETIEGGWVESRQCVGGHIVDTEHSTIVMPYPVSWCEFWADSLGSSWIRVKDLVKIVGAMADEKICSGNTRDLLAGNSKSPTDFLSTGYKHYFRGAGLECEELPGGSRGVGSESVGQCSAIRFDIEKGIVVAAGINAEVPELRDICLKKLVVAVS